MVGRKVAETMAIAQCSPPGQVVGSGLLGLHSRIAKQILAIVHTETFPGCTVFRMADVAITQIKSMYVLHTHSQN